MIKVGILTISDKGSRGEREDLSGKVIKEIVKKINGEVKYYQIIPDEKDIIQEELIKAVDKLHLDLILTTGGTGLGKRDVTRNRFREKRCYPGGYFDDNRERSSGD